jgi:solute:Na+ symporter, SSS family
MNGLWLDLSSFVAYLAVVFAFGIYMSGREQTAGDFFLAGWRLPWYAIAISLFASNISSGSLIALAGDAYRYGIAVAALEWGAIIGLTLLAFVFLPFYRGSRVFTTPEFLERRYGPVARTLFAITAMVVEITIYMPYMFYAGALFLGVLFDFPFVWSVVGIAVFVGAYTTFGGLAAVVWTDVLQGILMLIGGALVTICGLIKIGGLTEFMRQIPESHIHVGHAWDHPAYPFPASMLGGYLLVTIYYWCQNQTIVQRALAARSDWDSKMGAVGACYIKLILPFVLVLPGMLAVVLFPELGNGKEAEQALPLLIRYAVPAGLTGIVMASMVAALMSSADSGLNSLATIFTNDLYKRWIHPTASEHQLVTVGRLASVAILAAAVARALTMKETPSLMQFLQAGLAYLAAPVIVVFAAGIFWRGATSAGAVTTLVTAPLVCFFSQNAHLWISWWPTHMVYWLPVAVGCLTLLLVLISLVTPRKSDEQLRGLLWSNRDALAFDKSGTSASGGEGRRGSLIRDYRFWAVLAIVLMVAEIWYLR